MTNPSFLELERCGDGDELVDVLVVPGIFESLQLAYAYAARLRCDAARGLENAKYLLGRYRFVFRSVVPPGYEDNVLVRDALPDGVSAELSAVSNETYRSRIRASEASRPEGARAINVHHSWGAGVAAPTWTEEKRRTPELTILSAPAWSDCVKASAKLGARALVIPVVRWMSSIVVPLTLLPLYRTKVPEIRRLASGMPASFSSYRVAYESYLQTQENPALYVDNPPIHLAGEHVVLYQGRKDTAVNGPRALRRYRELAAGETWTGRVELIEDDSDHWPLLESPETFAGLLRRTL